MSSEIQFGEVEQNEPQIAVRPDRDAHYSVATVGDVNTSELQIYVDLDVQRDMEAHALTNTRVELGGVMLGKQCIDSDGKPFVLVTDSLRARHYEATRGSFKFTHETWSQITGERNQYHPDLEMVGWYHTHPGWTVFLSPMDLFICNNFFNRQLDVALVIDPCNDDRGWFQWNAEHETQRTGGFYLTSNRYREDELNYFASLYNHEPTMNSDPRYSGYHIGATTTPQAPAMDNRKPWFDLMMVAMMLTQLVFIGVMLMQLTRTANPVAEKTPTEDSAAVTESLQNQSLKLALTALAESTGQEQIANRLVELETDRKLLAANLDGQLARVELVSRDNDALRVSNRTATEKTAKLESQIGELKNELAAAKKAAKSTVEESAPLTAENYTMPWLIGSGALGLLLGGGLMFFFGKKEQDDLYDPPQRESGASAEVNFTPQATERTETAEQTK